MTEWMNQCPLTIRDQKYTRGGMTITSATVKTTMRTQVPFPNPIQIPLLTPDSDLYSDYDGDEQDNVKDDGEDEEYREPKDDDVNEEGWEEKARERMIVIRAKRMPART